MSCSQQTYEVVLLSSSTEEKTEAQEIQVALKNKNKKSFD